TNRTAIAAALLGLLATIARTRAQAECVCSPRKYSVSFNLAQDCANTDEISGLPGILDRRFMKKCNSELIEVTQVQIFEEGYEQNINTPVIDLDTPVTSGTIEYTSKSNELQPGDDLDDQVDNIIPIGISVYLLGNDQNGGPIGLQDAPYASITYTNECGSGPIVFDDSGLGNFNLTTVEAASLEWCALPPPTVSPSPTAQPPSTNPPIPNTPKPTDSPTITITAAPSASESPTVAPVKSPTTQPSVAPTNNPSSSPTIAITTVPSKAPSKIPTFSPTTQPSAAPTSDPSSSSSPTITVAPSKAPSNAPTPFRPCQKVPACVCSPQKYELTFDMNQDCASTDDITGSPGIGITYKSCNSDMIEVTRVEIIEEGTCENINRTVIDYDTPVTSGSITYISKTTELQP
ncbi:hypothetical protein ACHAWC_000764, partial [Mediolabrus comicus]